MVEYLKDYFTCLPVEAQVRYTAKLALNSLNIPDPYALENGWVNNPLYWPEIAYPDIYTYLMDTPGIFTKESMKAYKSLEAYNFFISGNVQTIFFNEVSPDCPYCLVRAKVMPSQKVNDKPHEPWVCLDKTTAEIQCAHCTCKAGLGESCSHMASILFKMEAWSRHRYISDTSCTSQPCEWNMSFKKQVRPSPIEYIQFCKPKKTSTKPILDNRVHYGTCSAEPAVNTDAQVWQDLRKACPSACVLFSVPMFGDPTIPASNTDTSWDLEETDSAPEEDETVLLPLQNQQWSGYEKLSEESFERKKLFELHSSNISHRQKVLAEKETRKQSESQCFFYLRYGRITASLMHRIKTRTSRTAPDALVKQITSLHSNKSSRNPNDPRAWGRAHEDVARGTYVALMENTHVNFKCSLSGFVIDENHPFIGASPDGIRECDCHGTGILEIKCPSSCKDGLPKQNPNKQFFLDSSEKLKKNGQYYTQIQTQMFVCKLSFCDFFVWTPVDNNMEQIFYDEEFILPIIEKSKKFYFDHVLPVLMTKPSPLPGSRLK